MSFNPTATISSRHIAPVSPKGEIFLMFSRNYQEPEFSYYYWYENPSRDSYDFTGIREVEARARAIANPDSEMAAAVRKADFGWLGDWTE